MNSRAVTFPTFLWTDTMDVYAADPDTGTYTVLVASGVICRLCETSAKDIAAGPERAVGIESRVLIFPPEFDMDALYQVEIRGHRWNLTTGSDQVARGPSGELVYRSFATVHATDGGDTGAP